MLNIRRQDINKTINYMRRNGVKKAVGMVYERLTAHYDTVYSYEAPAAEELEKQKSTSFKYMPLISIAVPAYETKEEFLEALIDSVTAQSYQKWELILADASESGLVKGCVEKKKKKLPAEQAGKIKYHALSKNEGISGNSNQAISHAKGDYIGLLDHDDLLTPDALYEMVNAINGLWEQEAIQAKLLYSDEDKCDETGQHYYEGNIKPGFNFDFLLSNNYVCHFLLMEAGLMRELGFRHAFDGSQDYDLILRAVGRIQEREIAHIGKVLYHWRCHELSTAGNPASKLYAYEAGKRAVQDFLDEKGIPGKVGDTEHLGFYKITYAPDIFTAWEDVGAVGGSVVDADHKITSGILLQNGICPFAGFYSFFSGPANVASVGRDAYALDARTMILRREDIPLFEELIKVPYVEEVKKRDKRYCNSLDENIWRQRSMALCAVFRERGKRLVWDPSISVRR
ncbi:MAG: glycosyltransferase [Lachnospiraceae bacterium]|nr:glycosyltransferase [Lachnospiraceae bacterium]